MNRATKPLAAPSPLVSVSRLDAGLSLARGALGTAFCYHVAQKLFGGFGGGGPFGFANHLESLGTPLPLLSASSVFVLLVALMLTGPGSPVTWARSNQEVSR